MRNAEFKASTTVNASKPFDLKARTKQFALRVIKLVNAIPASRAGDVIGKQLIRCGTSVGANYRAACRARSAAEFCAKLGIVEEESDESAYWIELLGDSGLIESALLSELRAEANEITAIVVSSIRTARPKPQLRKA